SRGRVWAVRLDRRLGARRRHLADHPRGDGDRGRVRHAQRCQESREKDHGRRGLTLRLSPNDRSLALIRDESAEEKNGLTAAPPALTQEAGLGGLTCGLCNLGPALAPHVLRGSERSARLCTSGRAKD